MKDRDFEILALFRGNPNTEMTTEALVQEIYSKEFQSIHTIINDSFASKDAINEAKKERAKLHRRILHHLSKLLKEDLLKVTDVIGKGQKKYALKIQEGEELILDKFKRRLVISKPSIPALPLGDLENEQILFKVEPNHFFDRVNCVLVESENFTQFKDLYDFVYNLFSHVNDVIGLNNFEYLIQEFKTDYIVDMVLKLDEEARAYNKRICCSVDITKIDEKNKVLSFLKQFISHDFENITFVFDTRNRELLENSDILTEIISLFAQYKLKLNIKNDDISPAPYMLGKAGPYTFSKKDWVSYSKKFKEKSLGVVCAQSSILLDLKKLYTKRPSAKELKDIFLRCGRALHISNVYQRRNAFEFYKKLNPGADIHGYELFNYSKNYIRLWHYEVFETPEENDLFIETLKDMKQEVEQFARTESTIYNSCGMPISFHLDVGLAYRRLIEGKSLTMDFEWIRLKDMADLYKKDTKKRIQLFEKASDVFSGGFEIRFFREGAVDPLDIIREMNFILNSYKVPVICYNFSDNFGKNTTLSDFIQK